MKIIDTTLREGEQATGVFFSLSAKQHILGELIQCGIDEVELGIVDPDSHTLAPLCSFCRTEYPHHSYSLWCRCLEKDIRWAAKLKPPILSLSIPASDLHLEKKLGKDRRWARQQLHHSIHISREAGIRKISVGLEDASRADPDFISELACIAAEAGAFRLRLADTVGIASPADIIVMLDTCTFAGLESAVHCHNDFGMATANSITALEHGAMWADVTVLGLGERAGNSRLEEVAAYLAIRKKADRYNIRRIPELSRLVADLSNRKISAFRPIVGRELFACETGLHLQGLAGDPATYEPFTPALVGNTRKMLIGRKVGRRSVACCLRRLGLPEPNAGTLTRLTGEVRTLAADLKRPLDDHEIISLVESSGE